MLDNLFQLSLTPSSFWPVFPLYWRHKAQEISAFHRTKPLFPSQAKMTVYRVMSNDIMETVWRNWQYSPHTEHASAVNAWQWIISGFCYYHYLNLPQSLSNFTILLNFQVVLYWNIASTEAWMKRDIEQKAKD